MDTEFQNFDNQNQENHTNDYYNQTSQNQGNPYYNTSSSQGQYYGNQPATEKPCGMAIAGMVLGILSMVCCCIWYISGILAILALIFSIITIVKKKPGKGMAIAGVICGAIGLIIAIVMVVGFVAIRQSGMSSSDYQKKIESIQQME